MRVTYREIAEKAGVSRATVHRCLHDDPLASRKTRERVQKIARDLGYREDELFAPMRTIRSHSGYVQDCRIALIGGRMQRDSSAFQAYRSSICQQALELDFDIRVFDADEFATLEALRDALRQAKVGGAVLEIECLPDHLTAGALNEFALMACGMGNPRPYMHSVQRAWINDIESLWTRVLAAGKSRVGLLTDLATPRGEILFEICLNFLKYELRLDPAKIIPPYNAAEFSSQSFAEWCDTHQPEVLWGYDEGMYHQLLECGYQIPKDFAYVALELNAADLGDEVGGFASSCAVEGALAVKHLYRLIAEGEYGMPDDQWTVFIEPKWIEGRSLAGI